MLWSINTVKSSRVFFEVIRWQIISFKLSQAQVYFFQWFISNMLCLCHSGPTLLGFWFQTDLGRKNSASFLKNTGGEDLFLPWSRSTSNFMLWLVKIWQVNSCVKFMSHLESCWLWQLKRTEFCVNLRCFNCLFPLVLQNEIQRLSRVFCYSWLVWLMGFWLRNVSLVKIR